MQHTGSSTWYFSSTAKIGENSEKWSTPGSSFSNNDGSWGVNKGIVDGSNICGKDENGWWGHENCGGSQDFLFCNRFKAGGKVSDPVLISNNIRNEMYLGTPDLNSNVHDVQGYLLNPMIYTAGKIGVSYTLIIHNLFATTFPRYSSWKGLPESLKSRFDIYINLPERLHIHGK